MRAGSVTLILDLLACIDYFYVGPNLDTARYKQASPPISRSLETPKRYICRIEIAAPQRGMSGTFCEKQEVWLMAAR